MLAFLREAIELPTLLVVYLKNGTMSGNLLALNTMRCRGSTAINRLTVLSNIAIFIWCTTSDYQSGSGGTCLGLEVWMGFPLDSVETRSCQEARTELILPPDS